MRKKKIPVKLKVLPIIIAVVVIVIIMSAILLVTILKQNYIVYENVAAKKEVSSADIKSAQVIIVDNIVIGGHTNGKWIDAKTIYDNNKGKIDIDMYSETAKYGTYKTATFKYNLDSNIVYTITTRVPTPKKYIAKSAKANSNTLPSLQVADANNLDTKNVKKAMGKYRFLNNSVKVINAYDVFIEKNIPGRLIVAASDSNLFGVYSTVVYVGSKGPQLVKYAYVKNSEKSVSWPIYSASFVIDIDDDGISETILQETTETTTSYVIVKYEDNMFKEVLKQTINL